MRGKGTAADFSLAPTRITPAYAGKSLRQYAIGSMEKDHPRLCGEKSSGIAVYPVSPGSPPPMRGKVHNHLNW